MDCHACGARASPPVRASAGSSASTSPRHRWASGATTFPRSPRVGGQEYSEGYSITRYRDLETRYLYRKAAATVTGVEVKVPAGLKVGYVMGIGDEVPAALAQLGADVQLLGERELAGAQLSQFDAIFTGTRAMPSSRI